MLQLSNIQSIASISSPAGVYLTASNGDNGNGDDDGDDDDSVVV